MKENKIKTEIDSEQFLTNTIVVKFQDQENIPRDPGINFSTYLSPKFAPSLNGLFKKHPLVSLRRSVSAITPDQLDKIVYDAKERCNMSQKKYAPPNFNNFLKIECEKDTPKSDLVKLLRNESIVEYAYVRGRSFPGSDTTATKSFISKQRYLKAAPFGINAKFAWKNRWDGTGDFRFIDIEDGWDHLVVAHPDLPDGSNNSPAIRLLAGVNKGDRDHGNEVLGIILARDNGFGVKGIAPNVRTDVISEYFSNSSLHPDPVDAIAFANDQLHSGDVMLLTLQIFDAAGRILPIERDPEVFEKIKLATRKGIIVVEIAGNGGEDLDAYAGNNGSPNAHIFDRNVRDSGAIMVGSAKSRRPHRRFATSNFGKRVDCYAWGEKIATTTDERDYSFDFGQTSGAGAIIAGAAISVQSMHIAKHNTKLDCDDMRDILSHPSNGTPSQDLIGVMPDLKAIAIKLGAATGS